MSAEDRARAFNNVDLPEHLERLLAEVATGAAHVTDVDRELMTAYVSKINEIPLLRPYAYGDRHPCLPRSEQSRGGAR